MKKPLAILIYLCFAVGLAALAFGISYALHCDMPVHSAAQKGDVYAWMQHEFHLSADQIQKIKALDAAYAPLCDKHCRDITVAEKNFKKSPTPTLKAQVESLKATCRNDLTTHLKTVAEQMPAPQAGRYLKLMTTQLECMGMAGMQHRLQ